MTDVRVVYRVAVADPDREATLLVAFEHDDPSFKTGEIGAGGGPEIAFWQVIYS